MAARLTGESGVLERVEDLIEAHYANVPGVWRTLEAAVRAALDEGKVPILDAGCGRDAPWVRRFDVGTQLVGIDLATALPADLPVVRGDLSCLPFADASFSLIFCRWVFEHLAEPSQVLREFHRVLKPRGICLILTPNRYDYSSLVAQCTPHWFHEQFIQRLYGQRAYQTFPTYYRANTPGFFQKFISQHPEWGIVELRGLRHYPVNLAFSRLLFRVGILYDRWIAAHGWRALQPVLLATLKKRAAREAEQGSKASLSTKTAPQQVSSG
jgi:SAM-dependent methyltransferase